VKGISVTEQAIFILLMIAIALMAIFVLWRNIPRK
jgi:hypothetical protein